MKKLNNIKNLRTHDTAARILNQAVKLFLEKDRHGAPSYDLTQAAELNIRGP